MSYTSINPFNQINYGSFHTLNENEINNSLHNAESAFKIWKQQEYNSRGSHLLKLANLLINHQQELAKIITEEMGKPLLQSLAEIEKSVIACEYYAYQAEDMLKNEDVYTNANLSYIKYEPLGTILGIMPWNFPIWQVIRFIAPTLMAGNACLVKPAPNVPRTTLFFANLIKEAEFHNGIIQFIFVEISQLEPIIAHSSVKAVSLTGSTQAGRAVAALAGKFLKKCVLELGGSDPFIVLSTANIEKAVDNAIKSRLINNGQSCIAAKRFIIENKIYDQFLSLLILKLNNLKTGDPTADDTTCGPIARPDLTQLILTQVKETINSGAKMVFGSLKTDNNLLSPIVLTINKETFTYKEEIFGPVFVIIPAENEEDALEIANDSSYGLSASLWTTDINSTSRFIDNLEVGAVFVNEISHSDVRMPFGGVKNSGYGKELSSLGIKEFTNAKTVWIKNI